MNLIESYNYLKSNCKANKLIIEEAKKRNITSKYGQKFTRTSINRIVNGIYKNDELEEMIIELAREFENFFISRNQEVVENN